MFRQLTLMLGSCGRTFLSFHHPLRPHSQNQLFQIKNVVIRCSSSGALEESPIPSRTSRSAQDYVSELITPKQLYMEMHYCSNNLHPKLIDTRMPDDFHDGHIAGAVNIHEFFSYVVEDSRKETMETLRHDFSLLLEDKGIRMENRVVVYEETMDTLKGSSCRALFLLKYLGMNNVSVLHGGIRAWLRDNYPPTKFVERDHHPTKFIPIVQEDLLVDRHMMEKAVAQPGSVTIVDNRDREEWTGESSSPYGSEYCPRKGRIPGDLAGGVEINHLMGTGDLTSDLQIAS